MLNPMIVDGFAIRSSESVPQGWLGGARYGHRTNGLRAFIALGLTVDRRTFLAITTGAMVSLPLIARAQQSTKVWRIGIFVPGHPPTCGSDQASPAFAALRQAFRDLGYFECQNCVLVVRCATGAAQAARVAEEIAATNPDALIVASNELARAVKKAT